jgi:tetratricopeptide (TPR) repeat protein
MKQMKRKLNHKVLILLLAGVVVLGISVHFLHAAQVRRNAHCLLEQATKLEAANKPFDAAFFLGLYLKRSPSDREARARNALLHVRLARTARELESVYQNLDSLLLDQPDRDDLRRAAIQLAMSRELGHYSEARLHLHHLFEKQPDAELEILLARSWIGDKDFVKAEALLAAATKREPTRPDGYLLRARILRDALGKPDMADLVMDDLVKSVPSADAHLSRAGYLAHSGRASAAATDIEQALKLAPDHPEVLLAWASLCQDRKETEKARKALKRGIERNAEDERFYIALSRLEGQAGQLSGAIEWLRKGLEVLPNRPDLMWDLANLLADTGRYDDVSALFDNLRRAGVAEARLDFLNSRVLVGKGRWFEAAESLKKNYPHLQPWSELTRLSDLLLGQCCGEIGDVNGQFVAFHRAVKADPLWISASLGLGATLVKLGQIDDALELYQGIVAREPRARLVIARLLIDRTARLPEAEQRWKPINDLLDQAENDKVLMGLPRISDELAILRAEVLFAEKKPSESLQVLTAARDRHRDRVEPWIALARLAGQRGKLEDGLAILDQAARELPDSVELRLARVPHLARSGDKSIKELVALEQGANRFLPNQRHRLWRGLGEAHGLAGNTAQAVRLFQNLARENPNELDSRIALLSLALVNQDLEALDQAVEEVRRIEQQGGLFWRYGRAYALVLRARKGDRSGLVEARRLLQELNAIRPRWSRTALVESQIALLNGDRSLAIAKVQQAVAQGERSPDVLRQLYDQLMAAGEAQEADRIRGLLLAQSPALDRLNRIAAEFAVQMRDYDRALSLAQKVVADDSTDARDQVWKGQLLWTAGDRVRAEARFRRAVALAETSPEAWLSLVQFLARTGQRENATREIAMARAKLPPDQAALFLAQCHEAVIEFAPAQQMFDQALREKPRDPRTLRAAIGFRLRSGEFAEAELLLERLRSVKPLSAEDAAWARRTLAKVLTFQSDPARSRRALELLAESDKGDADEDLRVRALILATRLPRADRLKGIRLLEDLAGRQPLTSEDRFLLAQLYESVGDWTRARAAMLSLVKLEGKSPVYLARFIRALVRHGEADQAGDWLSKLENLQPESEQTIELKSRVLKATGKRDQAALLLNRYADRAGANLSFAAALLAELDQPGSAERVYRRWVANTREPVAPLVLAVFLARQNRLTEALNLCEQTRKSIPPETVITASLEALYAADVNHAQCARVAGWVEELLKKAPQNANLLTALASLRSRQGEFDESIGLYRRALSHNPNHALAMNNLAYLLAVKEGNGTEALALLNRAEAIVGPLPELFDTRAVVLLTLKQADQAIELLEDVVAVKPSGPGYFHLSQAHLAARKPEAALLDWRQAMALGLKSTDLHALERPGMAMLKGELKAKFPDQIRKE